MFSIICARNQAVDPWLGFGVGYEWVHQSATSSTFGSASATAGGFEFANVQIGADVDAAGGLRVGPFASYSVGEFRTFEGSPVPSPSSTGRFTSGSCSGRGSP